MLIRPIIFIIKLILSIIPLWSIQILGIIFGHLFHFFKNNTKNILIQNLACTNIYKNKSDLDQAINLNISETGKTILEGLSIWASPQKRVLDWVSRVEGIHNIAQAKRLGKGIIFLTPHLGAYEISSIYYGSTHPLTVLFRPSRLSWLSNFMDNGRKKGLIKLAPTNRSGIKKILQALREGEAIGILPDQAANKGEGEWVPFFNRPAYTMVLVSRLVKKTGASVIMVYTERLSLGKGFTIHLEAIKSKEIDSPTGLNKLLERIIRKNPTQYLWNYDKHKGYESQLEKFK